MNEFEIFSYNIGDEANTAFYITYKHGSIRSLPDIFKKGDIVTLLINEFYVGTCTIQIVDGLIFGWDTSPWANIIDIIMNGGGLYFTGFSSIPFVFDIVRPIENIKMISNGYNISSVPKAYIKSKTHIDIPIEFNIDTPLIVENNFELDHGGEGAVAEVEFDFGGTIKQLNDYIDVIINNGKVTSVGFNKLYMDTDSIWENYSSPPLFIYKSKLITEYYLNKDASKIFSKADKIREHGILDISSDDTRIELYEDALVGGIIDMGGKGFEGNMIYDNGGFSGKLILEEEDRNHFNIKCSNM